MNFTKWLLTFVEEKGIDPEQYLTIEGESGPNQMPVQVIIDAMIAAPPHEQKAIKDIIVKIDFRNGDVLHFFRHLGQALAI